MIVVFGSINLDIVFPLPSLPQPGETVLGQTYSLIPGGKGANQALAAARDGATVRLAGTVGRDSFADLALAALRAGGVDLSMLIHSDLPTGCAAVCVAASGENLIAVAGGANGQASATIVPDAALGPETTLVLQMEVPASANAELARRAKARGARVVLNLAPAGDLDTDLAGQVDVMVVNEGEAATLARHLGMGAAPAADLTTRLATTLQCAVVVTRGAAGCIAAAGQDIWTLPSLPITPVDTTGAGDAFVGVLAAALDRGLTMPAALRRANIAGALACLARGAQPSFADRSSIDTALAQFSPA